MLSKNWSLFSIITYILIGIIFKDYLYRYHDYANYMFDAAYILFFLIKGTSYIRLKGAFNKASFIQYIFMIILGFLTFKIAILKNIPIPFELNKKEVIIFLLLIGPILEELIFRFCIQNLSKKIGHSFLAIGISSILFSFSHFIAYFSVPEGLKVFVIYQAIYTLLLGLWWSINYQKNNSITQVIFLHIFFNLGFYLGSQFNIIRL